MQIVFSPGEIRRDLVELERESERTGSVQLIRKIAECSKYPLASAASGLEITAGANSDDHVNVTCARVSVCDPVELPRLRPRAHTAEWEYARLKCSFMYAVDHCLHVENFFEVRGIFDVKMRH